MQKNTQAEVLQIVAISGLGGIGKSELARKYACKNKEFYGGNIIWINAEDSKTMENSFLRLASRLGVSTKDKSGDNKAIETIIEEIYAFFEDVKSLFIFDNAEEYEAISKFLPFSLDHKPYILITSRDRKWEAREEGDIEVIPLDEFDEIEALEFVKKALNIQDNLQDKEVEELIRELQHFPLALGQAVACIYNKNEESWNVEKFRISDYLKEYRQEAEKLFKETEELLAGEKNGESRVRYAQTVLTTWNITRNRIADNKKYGKQAIDVLNIMAYLAPDDICIREIFLRLMADDEEKLKNAVKLLDRYSMINLRGKIVNIHRLVQKVTRLKLREEGQ
ncbi:NB-ARC domain-containing protein [Wolbachia endosymbiont (group E) of Neria commutata]|uniref:NB-ARC domain-containing protein n=1 Tax=Wolbachia endosymbiont (group E) of Neria commutata TaxID=3066149 RepID=UPI003132AC79